MGAILSYFFPLSSEADPITGLSPRDKYLVTSTWAIVKKDVTGIGSYIFELLFAQHDDVKNMFPFARGREWSVIREDPRLRAHVNSVMYSLTSFIDHLDDLPVLDAMIRKLADSHVKRKVTREHFQALGLILLKALEDKLGPRLMTSDTSDAWVRTYGLVLEVLGDQMAKTGQS